MRLSLHSPIQLKSQPPWNPSRTREVPISNPPKQKEPITPIQEELPSYSEASGPGSGFGIPDIPPPPYSRTVRAPPYGCSKTPHCTRQIPAGESPCKRTASLLRRRSRHCGIRCFAKCYSWRQTRQGSADIFMERPIS
jgi:hypothetical protein